MTEQDTHLEIIRSLFWAFDAWEEEDVDNFLIFLASRGYAIVAIDLDDLETRQ